jgi:hypothetical protein
MRSVSIKRHLMEHKQKKIINIKVLDRAKCHISRDQLVVPSKDFLPLTTWCQSYKTF